MIFKLFQAELEVALHKIELDNAKLEAELKSEKSRVEILEKQLSGTHEVGHLIMFCDVCDNSTGFIPSVNLLIWDIWL